jgi:hypothetical protein
VLGGAVNLDYAGDITTSAGASATVATFSHSGSATFHDGTIDVTGGDGFQFIDADGTYSFTGTTTIHGGDAGINVASGSSGSFFFGAGTSVTDGAIANFVLQNSDANVTYLGSLSQGLSTDNFVVSGQTGGTVDFSQAMISASAGSGLRFEDADGSSMLGDVQLSGGARIAIVSDSNGAISFGNIDITGLGANQIAVDLTGATGNVTFETLDIAGTSTTGSKGIDLTGSTTAANIIINESSSITGVGIGVDLTNAAITGNFRYGDGSNTDADGAASTISASVPIEIAGLNGGVGSYDFADVVLTGDTSQLVTSATTYFVAEGATGVGTMSDPGSLSGAEASGAQIIVLLNDPAGGQDVLDAATAGGSFDLTAGQSLLGFLNGDTLTLPAGGPANLILFGITPGQIINPFAGSGAPILTSTVAGTALTLGSNTIVDGIVIDMPAGIGISASGASNVTIRNSVIAGGSGAILLADAAASASAALSNLQLAAGSGTVLALDGSGAGTLTITALDNIRVAGGNGETAGISGTGVIFDADLTTAGFQDVSGTIDIGSPAARVGGDGFYLGEATGSLMLDLDVATDGGRAVRVGGDIGGLRLVISGGTIDAINGGSDGLYLRDLTADITLSSFAYSGTGIAVTTQNVTGTGPLGRALDIGTLTVADGASRAIEMTGSASGSFTFGEGSMIGTSTGPAIALSNTGASVLNYLGNINYAGADALLSVSGGHSGTVNFGVGTLFASSGTGLVFQNADGNYTFGGTTALATGISITAGSGGTFIFGPDTSIASPAGVAIDIQDSTASFIYSGSVSYSGGAGAAVNVVNHSTGVIGFSGGLLDITTGTGIRFDNADGIYNFDGVINLDAGAAGIVVTNGSSGTFIFGAGTSVITNGGTAFEVSSSTASIGYIGYIYAAGGDALNVTDHSVGMIDFTTGSTIVANSGAGIRFDNADGTYAFNGTTTLAGGGGIGIANGSAGTFTFGSGTSVNDAASAAFTLDQSQATVSYLGAISQSVGQLILLQNGDQSGADFTAATLDSTAGSGFVAIDADGTYDFGAMSLANGATLAITSGSAGNFTFGDVDITGLGANQIAVDLTGATGNVTFETLDIAGTSTTGSKGIDLTGSTTAANIIVNESSSITGVGIGVDLTNAAITGNFRYGDGSNVDADGAASTISAVTPLVIAGLNGGVGTYNFADVVLTGDTSGLQTNKTMFWVQAGATGAGTRSDPGSLAAAEASGADVIILLDTQGVGQDVLDASSTGGNLSLSANQSLLGFLNGDSLSVGGGAPANVTLFGISGGVVTNPYAGSGAPLLTTTLSGGTTVNLASGTLIDGVEIGNLDWKGVYAGYLSDVTIRNSIIYGGVNAIEIVGNGGSAALSNLDLSSSTGDVLRLRGDGGDLIVTQLTNLTIRGGNSGRGLFGEQLLFDANPAAAGIQTVTGAITIGSSTSRVGGAGLVLDGVSGALSLTTMVYNTDGDGIFADGGASGLVLTITGGSIDTGAVAASGSALNLANLSADIQLTSVVYDGPDAGVTVLDLIGVGVGGRALDIGTLTVTAGAANGIFLGGTTSGTFNFGSGSSIVGTTVAGIELSNTGTGTFTYAGGITGITSGAVVFVHNGDVGDAVFSGTLGATGGTGLQFDNADGVYDFGAATVTLNGGDAGIDVLNGSDGTFTFGTGTSITSPTGTGISIQDSAAFLTYAGDLTYATAGQAAIDIANHSVGTVLFQSGTLNIIDGTGLQFSNADGTYNFSGTTTLNGGDAGIDILNGSAGAFTFGTATSITSPTGIGFNVDNSTAGITYSGNLTYATAGQAAVNVVAHSGGTIAFQTGTLNVTNGTGLQFDDADAIYTFGGTTTLNGGDAGLDIVNGSAGAFTFGTGTSITSPSGTGINVADSTAGLTYSGNLTFATAGQAALNVVNHSGGTIAFQTGTLAITDGTGLQFDNADGSYTFSGTSTLNGGDAGLDIVNGSAGTFTFGAGTSITSPSGTGIAMDASNASVTYSGSLTYATAGNAAIDIVDHAVGTIDFQSATFAITGGTGLGFDNADGIYQFGSFALSGGARIAVLNGSSGALTLGDIDITGLLANQVAVDLTGAIGNVTFNTLDITGTSAVGSKGIDLTGNTGAGDIIVTNSSAITGVGVGVDLTNASRPGLFQYGDGESAIDVASTISATTPLVITGLNGATGTYNFADVTLTGDTSALATSATVYYVLAGASGAGTRADPGSLAGAEAATADIIILLNDPTGGQDVIDALGSNGNDTLALDVNQMLRSFRDGNVIALPGGAPANVIVTGVATGQVTNPYGVLGDTAIDRAPILTTTGAANTVTLANGSGIDGVFVQSVAGSAAVFGSGTSGVTISNATFFGPGGGLSLIDGGAAASATLTNLTISVTSSTAALNLSGAGAGTLTVVGAGVNVSQAGTGSLLTIADIAVGAADLGFGNVVSTASGTGVDLGTIGGAGTLSFVNLTVAGSSGAGVSLHNSTAAVNLGNVTVSGAAGAGIQLTSNSSGATTIGTVTISTSATGISASGLTNTLTVGDGTIDGASVAGILFGAGNSGTISFGNIDITGLQTGGRGVDARNIGAGNVTFATLDITGASATGTRGIDVTGNTGAGDFVVTNSSTITGVGVGVDLTNASRTGPLPIW